MDGRRRRRRASTQNPAYRPLSRGFGLVLVRSPDGGGGAGVADRAGIIDGAERERIVAPAEEAVDLGPAPLLIGQDGDVAHAAATDPPLPGDRDPLSAIDRVERHG